MPDFIFRGEIKGASELAGSFEQFSALLISEAKTAVQKGAIQIGDYARLHHPYKDRSGINTNSILPDPVFVYADSVECSSGPHTDYGKYLELGTRHIGSHEVFGKFAAHLGGWRTRPYPYMAPALEAMRPGIQSIFDGIVPRAKKKAGL